MSTTLGNDMIETNLIKALENKDNYFRYKELALNLYTEEKTKQILKDLETWFEDRGSKEVDWEDFSEWFLLVKHPMYKEEKKQVYRAIFSKVQATTKESSVIEDIISTFRARSVAEEVAQIAGRIAEGQQEASIDDIYAIVDGYYKEVEKSTETASPFVTCDTVELMSHVIGKGGYNWRLNEFNVSLGPLRKGDLILIGARPETGKTTALASEATYMAQQMKEDQVVLWINNEEEGRKVMWRVKQAALGWTTSRMQNYPHKVTDEYNKLLGRPDKILVCDRSDLNNLKSIEKLLEEYNVGLLIIDQLRKVITGDKTEGVQRLQTLYTTARRWAKDYCPVITVHQARGDAEGVDYIAANQLEGCQTEIQGELDAQIMIGKVLDPNMESVRYINIVKNKLAGGEKSDEKYRHGRHQVKIVPEIGRYESYE